MTETARATAGPDAPRRKTAVLRRRRRGEDANDEDAKNEDAENEDAKNEDAKKEDAKKEDAKNEDADESRRISTATRTRTTMPVKIAARREARAAKLDPERLLREADPRSSPEVVALTRHWQLAVVLDFSACSIPSCSRSPSTRRIWRARWWTRARTRIWGSS